MPSMMKSRRETRNKSNQYSRLHQTISGIIFKPIVKV